MGDVQMANCQHKPNAISLNLLFGSAENGI